MNNKTKALILAAAALLLAAAPGVANAERVFFLVGTRHVYRIGTYQYAHLAERQQIEQNYADQVAADRDQYNKAIAGGADPSVETPDFNSALNDLAVQRDRQLGAIFELADYERVRHPELRIEGDGPYQVIGINFHWRGSFEVFDNFVVYAPWPGYVVVGRPYGWSFGVVYSPFTFHHLYVGWYGGFVSMGRPAFVGLVGFRGPVSVVGFSRGPHGVTWAPRGGVGRVIGARSGSFGRPSYSHTLGGGRSVTRSISRGARPVVHSSFGGGRPASHGSFGRPNSGAHFGGPRTMTSTYGSGRSFGGGRATAHSSFGGHRGSSSGRSFGGGRAGGSRGRRG